MHLLSCHPCTGKMDDTCRYRTTLTSSFPFLIFSQILHQPAQLHHLLVAIQAPSACIQSKISFLLLSNPMTPASPSSYSHEYFISQPNFTNSDNLLSIFSFLHLLCS